MLFVHGVLMLAMKHIVLPEPPEPPEPMASLASRAVTIS